jgi:hypothetical protein
MDCGCQTEEPSLIDSADLRSSESATHLLGSPNVDIFPMAIERRFLSSRCAGMMRPAWVAQRRHIPRGDRAPLPFITLRRDDECLIFPPPQRTLGQCGETRGRRSQLEFDRSMGSGTTGANACIEDCRSSRWSAPDASAVSFVELTLQLVDRIRAALRFLGRSQGSRRGASSIARRRTSRAALGELEKLEHKHADKYPTVACVTQMTRKI